MSNYQKAETAEVNDFIASVASGRVVITAKDVLALCHILHEVTAEMREFDHVSTSFEAMADQWGNAIEWCTPYQAPEDGSERRGEYDMFTERFV